MGSDDDSLRDALMSFLDDEGDAPLSPKDDDDSSVLLGSLIEDASAGAPGVVLLPRARAKRRVAKLGCAPGGLPATRTSSSSLASASTALPAAPSGEVPPVRAAAVKRGRPTPQQKAQELERQVAEASKKAARLTAENAFMTERVRTLEMVRGGAAGISASAGSPAAGRCSWGPGDRLLPALLGVTRR